MKRIITSLTALCAFCVALCAQDLKPWMSEKAAADLMADRTRAGVNTNSYEFKPIRDTKAPAGYQPFYIYHYGRHGSRSNWGDRSYKMVVETLTEAKAAGVLSEAGEKALTEAGLVLSGYNGMDGRLTPRGAREHAKIAERMYNRYPGVFKKGPRAIRVYGSTVPRCLISMCSFSSQLSRMDPKLTFSWDAGEVYQHWIANTGNDETKKAMRGVFPLLYGKALQSMTDVDTTAVLGVLFTDAEVARKLVKSSARLQDALFDTACIAEDFDIEENIYDCLPFDFVYRRYALANLELYLNHSNSVEYGDIRVPEAKYLVAKTIERIDESLATGKYAADLTFGHDHPLLAYLCLLGIDGVSARYTWDQAGDHWFGYEYIPMASNLQMIFYRNKSGDILMKFLYQEQETGISGVEPVSGPYYRWSDVKAHLESKLAALEK